VSRSTASIGRLDGERLLAALRTLADDRTCEAKREAAARDLLTQLRVLSRCWVGRRLARGQGDPKTWIDLGDVVQHVALVASTGSCRFRGDHPGQAVAWCLRIFDNHLAGQLRRGRRETEHDMSERSDGSLRPAPGDGDPSPAASADVLAQLRVEALRHLQRTRRAAVVDGLYRAVCCYLDHVNGASTRSQIERWAANGQDASADGRRRARDRLYQYRLRGKQIVAELLGHAREARTPVGGSMLSLLRDPTAAAPSAVAGSLDRLRAKS
jgi:DNA-directed RNA polymerase specialized sigma24 family protein